MAQAAESAKGLKTYRVSGKWLRNKNTKLQDEKQVGADAAVAVTLFARLHQPASCIKNAPSRRKRSSCTKNTQPSSIASVAHL
jgi:hypothetical protein